MRSTIGAVTALGAEVNLEKMPDGSLQGGVTGWGAAGPKQPTEPIYCGNSGTTVRLLMGVLAPWDIRVTLTGDASLCKRPMRRIALPLTKMGASFEPVGQDTLPITEVGNPNLHAITYDMPVSSAQLKTAVMLAGLSCEGTTEVHEPSPSRNHTELMLPQFGAETVAARGMASVTGPVTLQASEVVVPGDPSSAAFLVCAALLRPGSRIQVENVSLNVARIGFTRTLERMGADIALTTQGHSGKEPYGIISASYTDTLRGCEIPAEKIAGLIDEVPVLSLVAAHAKGITVFRNVSELRVKESDRLQAIIDGIADGSVNAQIVKVVSSRPDAYGIQRAEAAGIPTLVLNKEIYADAPAANKLIADECKAAGAEYLVMAGYMRMVLPEILDAFPNRVLNLHPALLPSFKGAHAIADAFNAGVKVTGVTVHFANAEYDKGPIVAQRAVEVAENDTLDSLEEKIHAVEHQLYPAVVQMIAEGRVTVGDDGKVHIA